MKDSVGERRFLGMLTPSSNTVLEPLTAAALSGLPDVTAHFSRFTVTEISLAAQALSQFDTRPMLAAARLLADARVHSICWNGTSAGWKGFAADEELCAEIELETGIATCSSVLALNEIFVLTGVQRFGLVTPYLDDIQAATIANYGRAGFECVAERHLGDPGNFSFSEVSEATIAQMCREVAAEGKPEAISIFCTNLRGLSIVPEMEAELGIPIYDTIATAIWKSLKLAGIDPDRVKDRGRLFQEVS
jgi:maleate isomerase